MKLSSFFLIALSVGACLLLPNRAAAQVNLTQRDKSQIIHFILRTYDFSKSDTWAGNGEKTIYLLDENISPADIPSRHGVKLVIVNQAQIDRLMTTGVEYYRFNEFEIHRTSVRTYFVRTFTSTRGGNTSAMEYTCRKVAGGWKLKARLDGVGAT